MKRLTVKKALLCLLTLPILAGNLLAQSEQTSSQPLLRFDVFVNGAQFSVMEGDTLLHNNDTIVVKASNYLSFDFGAVSFDYPKQLAFEHSENTGLRSWTLDGSTFVIMYFEFSVTIDLDEFVKDLMTDFGDENCELSKKNLKLGATGLSGRRIDVTILGSALTFDIYHIKTRDFKTHFIAFQDSKNDDGSDSAESLEALEIINNTFKVK